MKAFVVAFVVAFGLVRAEISKLLETKLSEDIVISSFSAGKYFSTRKTFDCLLRKQIQEAHQFLKTFGAPLCEFTLEIQRQPKDNCTIVFKNPIVLDVKTKSLDDFKNLIKKSFDQLLEAMSKGERTTPFEVKADSFIYDTKGDSFLFADISQIVFSEINDQKLSKEEFITTMNSKFTQVLSNFKISDLNLDFELDDFKVNHGGFFEESIYENYQKNYVKVSQDNTNSNDSQKSEGDFEAVMTLEVNKPLKRIVAFNNTKYYADYQDKMYFSIYLCQNNKDGITECVSLKEDLSSPEIVWSFKIKKDIRIEIYHQDIKSFESFTTLKFRKIYFTLIPYDKRGVVSKTTPFLQIQDYSDKFILRDDGSEEVKVFDIGDLSEVTSFKMKNMPLKNRSENTILILRLSVDKVRKSKIYIDNPKFRYYVIYTWKHNCLVFSDESSHTKSEVFSVSSYYINLVVLKTCIVPISDIYATFYSDSYTLYSYGGQYHFKRYLTLIDHKTPNKELSFCFKDDKASERHVHFEYAGEGDATKLDVKMKFNSNGDKNENKLDHYKMHLKPKDNLSLPIFNVKHFEFPSFTEKTIYLSIKKLPNEKKFKIQGIYFGSDVKKGVIIHPSKDNLIADTIPQRKDPENFRNEIGVYLNDDEIVYQLDSPCVLGSSPSIKITDDKEKNVIIDCVVFKNWFSSDNIDDKNINPTLSPGLKTVIEQLREPKVQQQI